MQQDANPDNSLFDDEIAPFYGDARFPNAIAYPEPCPARPDRIAVIAVGGDTIMGMAGCSEDAPHWQQIGIDVLPEYRARGIGSCLVTLLKNKIIETGDVHEQCCRLRHGGDTAGGVRRQAQGAATTAWRKRPSARGAAIAACWGLTNCGRCTKMSKERVHRDFTDSPGSMRWVACPQWI